MSRIFDKTTDALATSLKLRQIRNNVTIANITNADTPHYHAQKVDFEQALAKSLELDDQNKMTATHGDHFISGDIPTISAEVYENPDVEVSNDGNTVNREKEMAALSENSIMYKSALQLINKKLAAMKYAIGEGR